MTQERCETKMSKLPICTRRGQTRDSVSEQRICFTRPRASIAEVSCPVRVELVPAAFPTSEIEAEQIVRLAQSKTCSK